MLFNIFIQICFTQIIFTNDYTDFNKKHWLNSCNDREDEEQHLQYENEKRSANYENPILCDVIQNKNQKFTFSIDNELNNPPTFIEYLYNIFDDDSGQLKDTIYEIHDKSSKSIKH
ncbi:hypothetical protein DMUE_3521, partial [Dictyocoela muelleri]